MNLRSTILSLLIELGLCLYLGLCRRHSCCNKRKNSTTELSNYISASLLLAYSCKKVKYMKRNRYAFGSKIKVQLIFFLMGFGESKASFVSFNVTKRILRVANRLRFCYNDSQECARKSSTLSGIFGFLIKLVARRKVDFVRLFLY